MGCNAEYVTCALEFELQIFLVWLKVAKVGTIF